MFGLKIKKHEDNIRILKTQRNKLDDSILDLQGILFSGYLFMLSLSLLLSQELGNEEP